MQHQNGNGGGRPPPPGARPQLHSEESFAAYAKNDDVAWSRDQVFYPTPWLPKSKTRMPSKIP